MNVCIYVRSHNERKRERAMDTYTCARAPYMSKSMSIDRAAKLANVTADVVYMYVCGMGGLEVG